MIYQPREDSYFLQKYLKHAKGRVLDVGTGSGIQALTAAKLKKVKSVLGIDIQKSVISYCRKHARHRKINFKQSDLFDNVSGKFDTIIFNPPYLPEDVRLKDITVDGGKKGFETLERFFNSVNEYLTKDGIILVLFSSLTIKDKVHEFITNNLLEYKELGRKRLFMEELYVYSVKKSNILKQMGNNKITNLVKFTKGHRGFIYTGMLGKKKIAVKIQRPDTGAIGTVDIEARILKLLKKHKIGPKLLFSGKDFFAYEFIEGIFIPEFLAKASKKGMVKVLNDVFKQCYKLDQLKINKEEMHHPYKHIVIPIKGKQNKPVLLDFERARKTLKPHNVTQFCQYVMSSKFKFMTKNRLEIDDKTMQGLAKEYKDDIGLRKFKRILDLILG